MVRNDKRTAEGIREAFALPPARPAAPFYPQGIYVLLRPAGPVAFYTQQWRALNLVWALAYRNDEGTALKDKKVVVVGAGAAGLTAAVGAALAGARVCILEKAGTPMSLQLRCEHRFLHPRFHYWPRRRSQSAAAALPLLTWSVGTAGEVADAIIDQFHRINDQLTKAAGKGFQPINPIYHVRDIVCREPRGAPTGCLVGYKVEDMTTGVVQAKPIPCDILIFAIGFGVERTVNGLAPRSYWRTDPLTQPSIGLSGRKLRVLVAGDGDGGAIDVLRAALEHFDHGPFIDRIIEMTIGNVALRKGVEKAQAVVGTILEKAKEELKEEFSERHDVVRTRAAAMFDEEYEKLLNDANEKPLDALFNYLKSLRRTDVEVTWVGRLPFASSLESYTLNRLLVWLVCKLPHVKYVPHRQLRRVEPVPIGGTGAWLGYSAYLQQCELADGRYQGEDRWESGIWDEVIVRYGGIKPLQSEFGAWGRELHKRWEGSAGRGTAQNLGEPGPGVAAFFEDARDALYHPYGATLPKIRLRALCLGEVEGRRQQVGGVDWPLFLFKLWIDPPAPPNPDETWARTRTDPRPGDDWVEYHLRPYRNGIRRRANRGPEEDFSLLIFTRDDYWVDASLKGGRRLAGGWLSKLLGNEPPKSLTDCAEKPWKKYSAEKPPPPVLEDKDVCVNFERRLARAPDDQSAEPEAQIPGLPPHATDSAPSACGSS